MTFCANSVELFCAEVVDVLTWVGGIRVVCSTICRDQLKEQYVLNAGIKSCLDAQWFTEKAHVIFDVA